MKLEESEMATNDTQQVVTGQARLSFVNLFTPKAKKPGDEPKYSTTILVPKSDVATKQRIDAAINAAIQIGTASKWNGVRPPILGIPIYDGDGVRPSDGMPFGEECKGHWVFTASSKQPPQVVDIALNPIINQSEIYSGVYARVSIRFSAYSNEKKGIGCYLGNVQKMTDGEPLGGRTSAADDFGAGAAPYNQAPVQQPQYQQAPVQQYPQAPQQPQYPQAPVQQAPVQYPQVQQPQQYQQPQYVPAQPAGGYVPPYPTAPAGYQQPQAINPITGLPMAQGGIMGL
jgi:hypothetical protein